MAKIDVIMPQMGESIAEGTLSKWLKKVGDPVKRDEPIFEISTDKVDAEIPAPQAGVLAEILVTEGQTVAIQTVVARIETDGASAAGGTAPAAAAPPAPATPPPAPAPAPKPAAAARPPAPPPPAAPAPTAAEAAPPAGTETVEERLRRKSTPLVRKIAAEHNLDISAIAGSGLAGRVTKNDVLSYLESGATAASVASHAAAAPAPAGGRGATTLIEVPAPVVEPWPGDQVEPWSKIRKLTADHMIMSRRVSAHVNSLFEVDFSRVAQLRAAKKREYTERGVNLTFLAFIVKAVADNLRKHPVVNAAVMGDATVFRRDINIGIAVALDWGLIVPVIRNADELALIGIARAINDLGERARTKKLSPDEVQRGTFTITNPGGFGSYAGTPIINQPQVAILGIGAIEKRPSVVTLPDGTDGLAVRSKGMLTMAYDHRIVDGADADRFLADVKAMLQNFPESAT
jgi:2-oxoglutarate dehydrogenase E2 component (dihydrolipoamide succinyltransferase)